VGLLQHRHRPGASFDEEGDTRLDESDADWGMVITPIRRHHDEAAAVPALPVHKHRIRERQRLVVAAMRNMIFPDRRDKPWRQPISRIECEGQAGEIFIGPQRAA
jgi:hypothetical protein